MYTSMLTAYQRLLTSLNDLNIVLVLQICQTAIDDQTSYSLGKVTKENVKWTLEAIDPFTFSVTYEGGDK